MNESRHSHTILAARRAAVEQARANLAAALAKDAACKAQLDEEAARQHADMQEALSDSADDEAVLTLAGRTERRRALLHARREAWQAAMDATQHARCLLAAMTGSDPT